MPNQQPNEEPDVLDLLEFRYEAELDDIEQIVQFAGTVRLSDWKGEYFKDRADRAWAWVRHLLEVEGVWECTIAGPEIPEERREIEVIVADDGMILRT